MTSANRILATLIVAVVVAAMAQPLMADPLIITVSRTDSSFSPISSTTLDTAVFPPALQDSAVLSPGVIPTYNTTYSTSLINPFAGTGVTWVVSGQVNVPGTPDEGLLQGGTILLHNSTATTYYAQITIEGGDYTLPSSAGDTVLATASFSASTVPGRLGLVVLVHRWDAWSAMLGTPLPAVGPDMSILYTRGATYRLKQIFDITLNGNPTNDPLSNVNISVTTTVTPVSEPWTIATLFAMILPIGLLFHHLRHRKQLAYTS